MSTVTHTDEPRKDPPESPPRRLRVGALGYLPVWLLLIGYFVWLCSQMSGEAPGGIGGSVVVAIGVAVLVGLAAGGLAMLSGRRNHD